MGYSTDFSGEFTLTPALSPAQVAYLVKFNETRRMKRRAAAVKKLPDALREAVGLPVGDEGGYYVGSPGFMGQDRDPSVLDYNEPPRGQPGLWCQWVPSSDGTTLAWDGGEKFYYYRQWLDYIIKHFLTPWGVTANGAVEWQGEEFSDRGQLVVTNNVLTEKTRVTYR